MLNDFLFNVDYGIDHVLDINGYDHVLFIAMLVVAYTFKDWKRVLLLATLFTIGHTLSLVLAAYGVVSVNGKVVEFLIPVTIFITALYNLLTANKKQSTNRLDILPISTLFFGLIHGLGFAREFKMFVDKDANKLKVLIEFALGIEIAQLIIVFVVLLLGYLLQIVLKVSRRDWVLVLSSIVIGLVIPMIIENELLNS